MASYELWRDRRGRLSALRIVALALLLLPLAKAASDYSLIVNGARPLNDLIHRTGFWALIFLGVSLAVTPFRRIGRYGNLIDVRRMIGVGTFCYAFLHFCLYVANEKFDLGKVFSEITTRVYLIIGMIALIGLAALAITSTDRMVKRMGGKNWRRLHQSVYVIALLSLIHYFQQTKADLTVPVFAASLFGWLLAYRLLTWWQDISELSTLGLIGLSITVAVLTFIGEAFGIAYLFPVGPLQVLSSAFDFEAGIRPGWQVLAAGLIVAVLDFVRARWNSRPQRRHAAA